MTPSRPDPDELLQRVQQQEAQAARGKLKIFFGASAGVGKTYAMLLAAKQAQQQGRDVLIGLVETHGRAETMALVEGLPQLPRKEIPHRDVTLQEFDLDAALARRPQLILVDELAHSNVAGSRHPKRWQDVDELLAAGIDVWSTVNVQHLESLNDIVSGITGIRVWETVPDQVFDRADEVVLVDLPPDELLHRLKQGKVYLPQQAERAIRNFFRKGNLIALRELALRRTADRVDGQMLQYRRDRSVSQVWQTRDAVLACIGAEPGAEKIVRAAARYASRLDAPWHVVHVETPALGRGGDARRQQVLRVLKLAQDMGAQTESLADADPAAAVERYARRHNLGKVVVGRGTGSLDRLARWREPFAARLARRAPDLDVIQVSRNAGAAERALPQASTAPQQPEGPRIAWRGHGISLLASTAAALAAWLLRPYFDLANIVMVFLLAVVFTAWRVGRGPAVLAAFVNVAIFDFLFVPPHLSLAVSDVQYLLTFAVMLVVALVVGQLTAGLTQQARIATEREDRVRALYEMSRDLSGALLGEQIAEIAARFVEAEFDASAALLPADESDRLLETGDAARVDGLDRSIAQWAYDHGEPAGAGTGTLPAAPVLYLPLKAPMRLRGVLALRTRVPAALISPEQRRLLDTCASLIAIALERIHYVDVAQRTTVQMESEQLRNSLLSAISHDLRTPLASLVALADTMALEQSAQPALHQQLRDKALRLAALVENLLDMARLQSGAVRLNRQWLPLEEVVGSARAAVAEALAGHVVAAELPDDLPLVQVDATLLERVLANLLENAAKYTPAGSRITVAARALPDAVELRVEDDGPGLPAGREEAIFNKFERGEKESATPGVGLGLAICRAIVEAHGGRITAHNRDSGGASFVFTLPRGTPPSIEAEPPAATIAP
ncbi:MAG: two-component system sensor histidine kinase KdbD [Aquabacterium sp.]|nr:MAG: two-component system sensor histidine kinase KdbD [Aquabacterium sp.]